jgi:hypothetical protein
MAISFDKQLKGAQSLNVVIRSLSDSVSRLASTFERVSESQKETVNYTRELEISQEKIGKLVGVQEEKQKSLSKVLEKQGTYYKNGLNYLKSWEQRLKALEKQTDSMLKKTAFHLLGLGTKVLQKVGKQINNIFSLKGALKLLKIGIGTALGVFAGLVATVKSVGGLIYKHMAGAFRLVSNVVKTSSGLVLSFFRKIWDTITMGGGEIRQAVAEMAQAFGMFNRTAGQAMNFLQANRRDWYQMGLSIGEATKYVIEYNKAYGRLLGFGREAKAFYVENIKMSRALGLEAEQSAKLSRSLQESSMTLKDFAFSLVGTFGPGGPLESMGVMIPEVARDIADSVDQLALMNDQNKKTFIAGAVWVRQYGFAIKDLSGMMDKFDTISSAAENVSKLNQMFGVSINAMEMLVDTDPAARLEKVQQKLLQAGKSWESMDYFQRKSLSSMMGLNAEQAQLVFSGKQLGKSRKEIAKAMEEEDKRQANSQKRQAEVMSAILVQLRASRGIMGSIMPIFYRVWVAFGKMFGGFLRGGRRGLVMFAEEWALGIKKSFAPDSPGGIAWAKMTKTWVKGWQSTMKSFGKSWGEMWANIDMEKFGKDFYGTIDTAISAIKQIINELFPDWTKSAKQGAVTINDVIHGIAERLQGIIRWIGENGADIIKGIGRVASATFNITKKVFQFFDKSNWGAAAVVMKDLFSTITQDMALILGYVDKTTGKMLNGFDPALAAAKGLQSTYMFMRDIVIDINKWWKKNGDEVKNFFKSAFETAKPWLKVALAIGEKTGAVIKAIGTFLAKNPALIGIIASFKAASFLTKGLTGMSLGQIGGGLLSGSGSVQKVYVTNASEIGVAAKGGGGGVGVGGRILSGASRGILGAGIGFAAGSMLESATGMSGFGSAGAGLGAGIGMGSALGGPIGAIAGGALGLIMGSVKGLTEYVAQKQQALVDQYVGSFNKYIQENNKYIDKILAMKSEMQIFAESIETINGSLRNQVTVMENSFRIADQQYELDKQKRTLEEKMLRDQINRTKDGSPEKVELRKQLQQLTKENARRSEVNIALKESYENQSLVNAMQAQELLVKEQELKLELQRSALEQAQKLQQESLPKLTEEAQQRVGMSLDTWRANSIQARMLAETGDEASIKEVMGGLRESLLSMKLDPDARNKLRDETIQAQKDALRIAGNKSMSAEAQEQAIRQIFDSVGKNVEEKARQAVEGGKFEEAMAIQEKVSKLQGTIGAREQDVLKWRIDLLKAETQRRKVLADFEAGIIDEETAKAQLLGIPTPSAPLAFGGLVKQATNALIGEAGPELAIPMRRGPVSNAPGTELIIQDYLKKINPSRTSRSEDHVVVVPINIDGRRLSSALVRIAHQSV